MPPVTPLTIARGLEERLRRCPGVAGLDPSSRLVTVGPAHAVRGVRVGGAPDYPDALSLELVALQGARLPDAAEAGRAVAGEVLRDSGVAPRPVHIAITDLAEAPLPPQVTIAPPSVARAAASTATASPGEAVRVALADADGRPVTLLISVEAGEAR